jgi:hypothetical protein
MRNAVVTGLRVKCMEINFHGGSMTQDSSLKLLIQSGRK